MAISGEKFAARPESRYGPADVRSAHEHPGGFGAGPLLFRATNPPLRRSIPVNAALLLSACLMGADPAVVPASGKILSGDCCGKAVVIGDCGCEKKAKACAPCAKVEKCHTCPKPEPVCAKPACDTCAKPKCDVCGHKSHGLLSCLKAKFASLCHKKSCDTCAAPSGCGSVEIAPATPAPAPKPPEKKEMPKVPPAPTKIGSHYNPTEKPETLPITTIVDGKIIIDLAPGK